jgi:hypothetical protein
VLGVHAAGRIRQEEEQDEWQPISAGISRGY